MLNDYTQWMQMPTPFRVVSITYCLYAVYERHNYDGLIKQQSVALIVDFVGPGSCSVTLMRICVIKYLLHKYRSCKKN